MRPGFEGIRGLRSHQRVSQITVLNFDEWRRIKIQKETSGTQSPFFMSSQFKRTIEDFTCGKCGFEVVGNGYTNHCPQCLWSRHVDVNPGDRAALETCGGMMEPTRVEVKNKEYTIIHKCSLCGLERPNRAVKEDNFDMLVQIAAEHSRKF